MPAFIQPVTPPLNMIRSGNSFTFTWPSFCTGFVLEGSSTVDGPVWTPLGSGTVVGANRQNTILSSNSTGFFRLRKDCPH